MTLSMYAAEWLTARVVKGRPLSPSTRYRYERLLARNILPHLGPLSLRAITAVFRGSSEFVASLVKVQKEALICDNAHEAASGIEPLYKALQALTYAFLCNSMLRL